VTRSIDVAGPLLGALRDFSAEQWATVMLRGRELRQQGQREAIERLAPSASLHSQVEKTVNDGLRPSFETIKAAGRRPLSLALGATENLVTAVMLRDTVSEEDLDLIARPFLDAGLDPGALDEGGA
jgi:hypothetical protein